MHCGILDDPVPEVAVPNFNQLADSDSGFFKNCFEETVRQARDRFI